MSLSALIAAGILLGTSLIFAVLSFILRRRRMIVFRSIPAFRILNQMMGKSVEQGRSLHLTLGSGSLTGQHSTIGFCGLASLGSLSRATSIADSPTICTNGDGGLNLVSRGVLDRSYRQAIKLGISQRAQTYYAGATPGAYITGTLTALLDQPFSGTVLIGDLHTLAVLLTGLPFHEHAALSATDNLGTQSALYTCSDETLLGEEAYAASAYTDPNSSHSASLITQDVLRWVFVGLVVIFVVLKMIGVQ